jgi:hypothetical protein
MSDTPKRLTWEEIGAELTGLHCPGEFREGLPRASVDLCNGFCRACWEPYLPEAAPTDKDDENKRLREAIRTALDTAEQNVDDPDTVLIDGLRAALEAQP